MSSKYLLNRLVELNPAKLFKKTSIYNNLKWSIVKIIKRLKFQKKKIILKVKFQVRNLNNGLA